MGHLELQQQNVLLPAPACVREMMKLPVCWVKEWSLKHVLSKGMVPKASLAGLFLFVHQWGGLWYWVNPSYKYRSSLQFQIIPHCLHDVPNSFVYKVQLFFPSSTTLVGIQWFLTLLLTLALAAISTPKAWFDRRFKNHWPLTRFVSTDFDQYVDKLWTIMKICNRLIGWPWPCP